MAYVKTEWENLPSENTPINASNLNKIENGIYQNSIDIENINNIIESKIAIAKLTSNTSHSDTNKIKFDDFQTTTNDITYNSTTNEIRIGSNISKILISGHVSINYAASNNRTYGFDIRKNNISQTGSRTQKVMSNPVSSDLSNLLLDVENGDIITMTFATDSGSTIVNSGTFITIEVIE